MSDADWKAEIDAGEDALDDERYKLAEGHYTTALLAMQEEYEGGDPKLAEVLEGLARSFCAQGKYLRGRAFYRRLLAIQRKASGDDHSDVAAIRANLAMIRDVEDEIR